MSKKDPRIIEANILSLERIIRYLEDQLDDGERFSETIRLLLTARFLKFKNEEKLEMNRKTPEQERI